MPRLSAHVAKGARTSETLCRKGGTSRSDNAPHASGACAGAKLACGATLSATREFAGLARVLNSLVVPPFLRRGILVFICAVAQRIDSDRMEQLEVTMCDFKFKRNSKYRG